MGPGKWRWLLATVFSLTQRPVLALEPPTVESYTKQYGKPLASYITADGQGFLYRWRVDGYTYSLVTDTKDVVLQEGRSMYESGAVDDAHMPAASWLRSARQVKSWRRRGLGSSYSWFHRYKGGDILMVEYDLYKGRYQPLLVILTYCREGRAQSSVSGEPAGSSVDR